MPVGESILHWPFLLLIPVLNRVGLGKLCQNFPKRPMASGTRVYFLFKPSTRKYTISPGAQRTMMSTRLYSAGDIRDIELRMMHTNRPRLSPLGAGNSTIIRRAQEIIRTGNLPVYKRLMLTISLVATEFGRRLEMRFPPSWAKLSIVRSSDLCDELTRGKQSRWWSVGSGRSRICEGLSL